jgi:hypothetical protein
MERGMVTAEKQVEPEIDDNRRVGFKTLVRNCLREFIRFINELSDSDVNSDDWDIGTIKSQLISFLLLHQKTIAGEDKNSEIIVKCVRAGKNRKREWEVYSDYLNFTFERKDLVKIYVIFEKLRRLTITAFEDHEFPHEKDHFIFNGEERIITSFLTPEYVDPYHIQEPLKYFESYEGTWVTNSDFVKSAAKSVRYGKNETRTEKGLKVYSKLKCYYYVRPTSPFKDQHSFAHSILSLPNDKVFRAGKKEGVFKVLSVVGENFSTLNEIVRSLIVQYYRLHGDFNRVSICKNCDSLYLEVMEDYQKYCSDDCNQQYHKKNRSKVKSDCRENQRRWAKKFIDKKYIKVPAIMCNGCRNPGLKGGECGYVCVNFKEDVLNTFRKKRGEHLHLNVCRSRQLGHFEGRIFLKNRKGVVDRGNIADKIFCQHCKQCKKDLIPQPGTCQRILNKFSDRISHES